MSARDTNTPADAAAGAQSVGGGPDGAAGGRPSDVSPDQLLGAALPAEGVPGIPTPSVETTHDMAAGSAARPGAS